MSKKISSREWELYARSLDGARREAALAQMRLYHVFRAVAASNWDEADERLREGVAIDAAFLLNEKDPSAMPRANEYTPQGFTGTSLTLLAWAAIMGDEEALNWALHRGAAVQTPVHRGRDAAWLAADAGNHIIAKKLLELGGVPNLRLSDGTRRTRLIGAVVARSVDMVRALLAKKVPVEAYDEAGRTALYWNMLQSPYSDVDALIGRILLAEGANPNSEDLEGVPAHALAEEDVQQNMLEGYKLKDATAEVMRRVAELRHQPEPEMPPSLVEPAPKEPYTPQIQRPPLRQKKPKPFSP
jgi:hypothetical protein